MVSPARSSASTLRSEARSGTGSSVRSWSSSGSGSRSSGSSSRSSGSSSRRSGSSRSGGRSGSRKSRTIGYSTTASVRTRKAMVKLEKLEGIVRTLGNPRASERAQEKAEDELFSLFPELELLNQNGMDAFIGEQLARLATLRRNRLNAAKKMYAARLTKNKLPPSRSPTHSPTRRSPSPKRTAVQGRRF